MSEDSKEVGASAIETAPAKETEKTANGTKTKSKTEQLHEFRETEGYVIDIDTEAGSSVNGQGVKLAKDGHTRLIPQPSDDENDPLNWSWGKKHLILFVISFVSFLPDYGSATGAVTLIPQAM